MSLEDITEKQNTILTDIREFYNQIRKDFKKEYCYSSPELQIQDKNTSGFRVLKADNIDDLLNTGGIVMNNGKTYGDKKDIEDAKYLKNDYEKYKKEIGSAIKELYGKDAKYDGYAFLDLGKDTYAAHIEVNGKKILAINKNFADWMHNPAKKREVYGHESMHNIGEKTELEADEKNAKLNDHLAKKLEHYVANIYKQAAKGAYQRVPTNEYGMQPCAERSY